MWVTPRGLAFKGRGRRPGERREEGKERRRGKEGEWGLPTHYQKSFTVGNNSQCC